MQKAVILIPCLLLFLLLPTRTFADNSTNSNSSAVTPCTSMEKDQGSKVIINQLKALAVKDMKRAYSFASANFRQVTTLERFKNIIDGNYSMLYKLTKYQVKDCVKAQGLFIYSLVIMNQNGLHYTTKYALSNLNGKWGVEGAFVTLPGY